LTQEVERGHVLLEINRHPVRSVEDYRRLTGNTKVGDILTLYVYKPEKRRRALLTVKIE
jgi:S1-C subfamily serine protease